MSHVPNFYCVGNASNHFSYIRYRLFHIVLKYLYFYVGRDPRFKKKNKQTKKVLLYQYIFEKYLKNVTNKNSKWWQIDPPENAKGIRNKPLILIDPGAIGIQTPRIILEKNAFHPADRIFLSDKALEWKFGVLNRLLVKTKGCCKRCGISLLDNEVKTEIHHILQVSMGGDNSDANLAPLCKGCHLYTTRVVRTKDIGSMYSLISKGVLAKETLDYFDLDPYHKALKIAKSYQHSQDLVPLNWI
jgi:hypothetical protein